MWLRAFEVYLTARLLASPTFHRLVRRVHNKVHEMRGGEKLYHPDDFTNLDVEKTDPKRFLKYYMEELRDQFRGTTKK